MEIYKPSSKSLAIIERSVYQDPGNQFFYSLGIVSHQKPNIITEIREGFSVNVIDTMLEYLDISQKEFLPIIGLSTSTLSRRRKVSGRLSPAESDNLYRVASTVKDVLILFEGDVPAARNWIQTSAKSLGNVTPLSLLDSQAGADQIRDLIGRMDSGVYT